MMYTVKESCSVCWRDFSSIIKPLSLACGHSYCYDCSILLRKCPLCRSRLVQNGSRPTNYALLSLIEKTEQIRPPETKDQQAQTDEQHTINTRRRLHIPHDTTPSHISTNTRKKEALKFKFTRGATGLLEGLEIVI